MGRFKHVFSLNYDLLVYWAMMYGNNVAGGHRFKDCFIGGAFSDDWEDLREPIGVERTTLVFYPHGNLVLATNVSGQEVKLSTGGRTRGLLDHIVMIWQGGSLYPLFVSEGEMKQKELAIMRSAYLRQVYNEALPQVGNGLVIFGWSADPRDDHILRRVALAEPQRVAISYFRGNRSPRQMERACEALQARIEELNDGIKVCFFDSQADGCWLRAEDAA
jgi:hypothetical protein